MIFTLSEGQYILAVANLCFNFMLIALCILNISFIYHTVVKKEDGKRYTIEMVCGLISSFLIIIGLILASYDSIRISFNL